MESTKVKRMLNSYAPKSYQESSVKQKSMKVNLEDSSMQPRTFFVDKGEHILLFKDINNFMTMGEEDNGLMKITGRMIGFIKEFEYQGEILVDAMDGRGELSKDGKVFKGKFKQNQLVDGTIIYGTDLKNSKMQYTGMIKDWQREGEGEIMIGKYKIAAHFTRDELREDLPVILFENGKELGPVEVIPTKNKGMYLLQDPDNDDMFIFDINKQKLRKSY